MKVQHKIKTYSVTWLSNTYDASNSLGVIENYYIPDDIDEFVALCKKLYQKGESFLVVGHTSNLYFRPNANIQHLVSSRNLTHWQIIDGVIFCECGVPVKKLVKALIADGVMGYACLVDLPGTVGAAIYGNAGVSHDSIANQLVDVTVLLSDGSIKTLVKEDLNFSTRFSIFKQTEMEAVILSCRLKCTKGDKSAIMKEAEYVHNWRLKNQPGPSRNLGTTVLLDDCNSTIYGLFLRVLAKILNIILFRKGPKFTQQIILFLAGMKHLHPYMCGLNRYMWTSEKGHRYFDDYVRLINKLYKSPKLEIGVIE